MITIDALINCFIDKELNQNKNGDTVQKHSDKGVSFHYLKDHLIQIHDKESWSEKAIKDLIDNNWIPYNWRNEAEQSQSGIRKRFCDQIVESDGILLEIAAGPGGGNVPAILQRNKDFPIIMNDISTRVLSLWYNYMSEKDCGKNVLYAIFDVCEKVIKDNSIDVVSSMGGLSETHNAGKVLERSYQMLREEGSLYSFENIIDSKDWERLPNDIRQKWELIIPGTFSGYSQLIKNYGFNIETHSIEDGRTLRKDEGSLPHDASLYDIELKVKREWIHAKKRKI